MSLRILVADDDLSTRLVLHRYLELQGYTVITATNGKEAMQLLEYRPQLLITDVGMPYLDGYMLVKQIRQSSSWHLLPIICLSGYTDAAEQTRGYQAGCNLFLSKPFSLDELGSSVRWLLQQSATRPGSAAPPSTPNS